MGYTRIHPSLFRTRVSIFALVVAGLSCEKPDPTRQMIDALGGDAAIDHLMSLSVAAECTGPSALFEGLN